MDLVDRDAHLVKNAPAIAALVTERTSGPLRQGRT